MDEIHRVHAICKCPQHILPDSVFAMSMAIIKIVLLEFTVIAVIMWLLKDNLPPNAGHAVYHLHRPAYI